MMIKITNLRRAFREEEQREGIANTKLPLLRTNDFKLYKRIGKENI